MGYKLFKLNSLIHHHPLHRCLGHYVHIIDYYNYISTSVATKNFIKNFINLPPPNAMQLTCQSCGPHGSWWKLPPQFPSQGLSRFSTSGCKRSKGCPSHGPSLFIYIYFRDHIFYFKEWYWNWPLRASPCSWPPTLIQERWRKYFGNVLGDFDSKQL